MKFLTIIFFALSLFLSQRAGAQNSSSSVNTETYKDPSLEPIHPDFPLPKRFLNSVILGIGAGTLIGIVAITSFNPRLDAPKKPVNIAKGASIGLYFGIVLGIYTSYIAPGFSNEESLQDPQLNDPTLPEELQKEILDGQPPPQIESRLNLSPLFGDNKSVAFGISIQKSF